MQIQNERTKIFDDAFIILYQFKLCMTGKQHYIRVEKLRFVLASGELVAVACA